MLSTGIISIIEWLGCAPQPRMHYPHHDGTNNLSHILQTQRNSEIACVGFHWGKKVRPNTIIHIHIYVLYHKTAYRLLFFIGAQNSNTFRMY